MEDVAFVDRLKVVPALINACLSPNTNNRLSVTPSLQIILVLSTVGGM